MPISERPSAVRPEPELVNQLQDIQRALDGALALLSGRPLAAVAELFAPMTIAAAGVHGLERWSGSGVILRARVDASGLDDARSALLELGEIEPKLVLEDKGEAFAIHYRAAPDCAKRLYAEILRIAASLGPGFHVQPGLYVFELKPRQPNKGSALLSFMTEAPFRGRLPVAIGDDLTDLHAFRAAESLGGMGVAVGDRIRARWRLRDPSELRQWLARMLTRVR